MIATLRHRIQQDALPLLLYLITFVVMSYPFVFTMGTELPMDSVDTHTALWQNWWVLDAFEQGYDVNHSPLLFYPVGLDVTLQPRRWASLPVWTPFYLLFGDPLAFNLTMMFGVLFKAYGMYLVGLHLFKSRIPAWVTGAFYAFAATSLQMALQQPNTGATEWIPWFMLAFMMGVTAIQGKASHRRVMVLMVLAGFLFAMNAYMNLKIALFAMLLGGGYIVLATIAHALWRLPMFWLAMGVFAVSALGFSAPILVPAVQSTDLGDAINDGVVWRGGIDMMAFVKAEIKRPINYMQSIASLRGEQLELQNIWGMSHVGIVGLVFALMGLWHGIRVKRTVLMWGILVVVFWGLSLGLEIRFRFEVVNIGFTPYDLLKDNVIFQILKFPWRMSLVMLFPFSILVGYGLQHRLRTITWNRTQIGLLVMSVVMLLYGTSIFPIPTRPAPRPAYQEILADLPDGAIIDLPFGRHNSKYYMSIQRFHGRPIIEGMIARTPSLAFDYIDGYAVLGAIRVDESDARFTDADWQADMQALLDDGFRYIILHKFVPQSTFRIEYPDEWVVTVFADYTSIYDDNEVSIYDITDLLSN